MHAFAELLEPSVVTHTLVLPAGEDGKETLFIIRGGSLLQVYDDIQSPRGPRWVAEFPLQAKVTSMQGFAGKFLILTVLQAKMVVLQWDPLSLKLLTRSMHFYEKLAEESNFDVSNFRDHHISVDEQNGCLMFWFQREFAAFIRFLDQYDPLKQDPSHSEERLKAQSSILKITDLAASIDVSDVEDFVLLPEYREPTLAVLGFHEPSWAGLVGAEGGKTKVVSVVTLKQSSKAGADEFALKQVLRVPNVPYHVTRLASIKNVPSVIAILMGVDEFMCVTEAGELCKIKNIEFDDKDRFENCELIQLPGTKLFMVILQSGKAGVLNPITLELQYKSAVLLEHSGVTNLAVSPTTLVAASQHGNAKIYKWAAKATAVSDAAVDVIASEDAATTKAGRVADLDLSSSQSLVKIYEQMGSSYQRDHKQLEVIEQMSEILSYGSFTSITSIHNGLACGTKSGVLISERDLPIDDSTVKIRDANVESGKFWVLSSTQRERPIMVYTYREEPEIHKQGKSSAAPSAAKKRRRTRSENAEPRDYTVFGVISHDDGELQKAARGLPRGLAADQLTLTVRERGPDVIFVQEQSIALLAAGSFKLIKKISIPQVCDAEIQGDLILVRNLKTNENLVYSVNNLELVHTSPNEDFAAISGSRLLTAKDGLLNVYSFATHENSKGKKARAEEQAGTVVTTFNVSNLDMICEAMTFREIEDAEPTKNAGISKSADGESMGEADDELLPISGNGGSKNNTLSSSENEQGSSQIREDVERASAAMTVDQTKEHKKVNAIFALKFNGAEYAGLHVGRVFAIYAFRQDRLVKCFTVPFGVNQAPIFLESLEMLIFPGAKSYVVVKGRQAGFKCHMLGLNGDKLIDATSFSNYYESKTEEEQSGSHIDWREHEWVWLDDRNYLHFSKIIEGIDYLSNKLPLQYTQLEVEGITIKDISYYDEHPTIIVGANLPLPYIPPHNDPETEVKTEIMHTMHSTDAPEPEENVPELVVDLGTPAEILTGRIYALSLFTRKFQAEPILSFDETLLCSKLVDYGESGGKQMLAVGTSKTSYESEETNGHVHLYKVVVADSQPVAASSKPEKEEPNGFIAEKDDHEGDAEDEYVDDRALPVKLELFAHEYVRGAVSRLTEIMGYLAVAQGQQILLYNFHKKLEPVGFVDTSVYMHDLKSIRNILILGERLRGPRLVNFALNPHRLDLLSSWDALGGGINTRSGAGQPNVTTAVEGISNALRGDLAIVHTEADGRLQLFQYDPENPASNGGHRLVPLASFFTGRLCNALIAAQLHLNDNIVAYGATADGTIFNVRPINEESFRAMFVLTQQMMDKELAVAGMNPRMYRANLSTLQNNNHQLIDVNYAQNFWQLPLDRQAEYARRLGLEGLTKVQRALNIEGRDILKL